MLLSLYSYTMLFVEADSVTIQVLSRQNTFLVLSYAMFIDDALGGKVVEGSGVNQGPLPNCVISGVQNHLIE